MSLGYISPILVVCGPVLSNELAKLMPQNIIDTNTTTIIIICITIDLLLVKDLSIQRERILLSPRSNAIKVRGINRNKYITALPIFNGYLNRLNNTKRTETRDKKSYSIINKLFQPILTSMASIHIPESLSKL